MTPELGLYLPRPLAMAIRDAALRAYPKECCGLLEGVRDDDGWPCDVSAVHETENIHEEPHRNFLIDPQAQFDLMRRLRGGATSIIGCFHSHPDRTAIPSAIDLFSAYENNFIWLIAGTSRSDRPEELQALFLPPYFLHAYCFAGGRFWHLPIQTQTFDEAVKEYFPDDCPFDD